MNGCVSVSEYFWNRLWESMDQSIPFACQDWASTKAAYRFLSNERVNERDILSGYFAATADRFKMARGTALHQSMFAVAAPSVQRLKLRVASNQA
jgi:hypothetical protein